MMPDSATRLSLETENLFETLQKPWSKGQTKLLETRGFPSPSFNGVGFALAAALDSQQNRNCPARSSACKIWGVSPWTTSGMEVKGWKGKYLSYSMGKISLSQENLALWQFWLLDPKFRGVGVRIWGVNKDASLVGFPSRYEEYHKWKRKAVLRD